MDGNKDKITDMVRKNQIFEKAFYLKDGKKGGNKYYV